MYNINDIKDFGFLNLKPEKSLDLIFEIKKLCKQKNAIILGHFYQTKDIQDISDFIGDSLNLSQEAYKTNAQVIVFAGVHFMAETAKIINPSKKVLIPDLKAGCSLADSCNVNDFVNFKNQYPDHLVISYVNTTAEIKAQSDIICTSSNAELIINSLPKEQKIIFGPDRNMGNYLNSITKRNMVVWNGACHVHEAFSVEKIIDLKEKNKDALILAHPECQGPILKIADFIGSTAAILKFSQTSKFKKFIVATESGILHQMQKNCPDKIFIPAPPIDSSCGCNDCNFMKLNTLEKIYICLKYELPEIVIDEELRIKAEKPILKMLELSEKLKI